MEKEELNVACNRLWEQQGVLFNKQRDCILYLQQFVPKEFLEDYNIRVNDINVVLNECKELDEKIRNK
jgi:hypothetical protein